MDLKLVTTAERPDLIDVMKKMWKTDDPKYYSLMLPATVEDCDKSTHYFLECQPFLFDGLNCVGFASAVPLFWNDQLSNLPDEGWQWALHTSTVGYEQKVQPNLLCGTSVFVDKSFRGKGMSKLFVQEMMSVGRTKGFDKVIIPVRPAFKHKHPHVEIDQYMTWRQEDGYLYDPWLRVHEKLGAQIIKPCRKSLKFEGSVEKWVEATGLKFGQSGEYEIPYADTLLSIDKEHDKGVLMQPNIWIVHYLR